ncbi:hypothetical protein [Tepidiforma sp.]|uniref:hypothetical protein n=1 Tax=Tepidiforma sp. TaxID=2682230 RepID=UPI002ADDA740|nr:hypothetical protein [Tepidiforma sp.]
MKWFRRRPRITDEIYGNLMTSFGRVVDRDPLVKHPAAALAERVAADGAGLVAELDRGMYPGATLYHLRLLAGAWIMAREGTVPLQTAEVFEEALVWRFEPVHRGGGELARRLSRLARGEGPREGLQPGS